jgi:hypothetical protein
MNKMLLAAVLAAGVIGQGTFAFAQEYPAAMPSAANEIVSTAVPANHGDGAVTFVQTNAPVALSQAVPNSIGDNFPTFTAPDQAAGEYAMADQRVFIATGAPVPPLYGAGEAG